MSTLNLITTIDISSIRKDQETCFIIILYSSIHTHKLTQKENDVQDNFEQFRKKVIINQIAHSMSELLKHYGNELF